MRRAHYYLGNVTVAEKGRAGLEEAIPEFQAELKLAPQDPLANLELGMALVDTQRPEEALPALEIAARSEPPQARTLYYLGRAQLGVGRPAEATASLRRALALLERDGATGGAAPRDPQPAGPGAPGSGRGGGGRHALRRGRAPLGPGVGDLARGPRPADGRHPGAGGRRAPRACR